MARAASILVLGLGNSLLSDDGVGVHVIHAIRRDVARDLDLTCIDGGTLGLSLLPEIECADALILVDASEIGAAPGTVRLFEGTAMDAQLGGKKRTAHEVAAADLLAASALTGQRPALRALIAVQPQSTGWGLEPTEAVKAAIPQACTAVATLARAWRSGARGGCACLSPEVAS